MRSGFIVVFFVDRQTANQRSEAYDITGATSQKPAPVMTAIGLGSFGRCGPVKRSVKKLNRLCCCARLIQVRKKETFVKAFSSKMTPHGIIKTHNTTERYCDTAGYLFL